MPENLNTAGLLRQGFEILRFGLVGGLATLTHLGAAYILAENTALPLLAVNALAFAVAFGVSFFGHYNFTFKASGPKRESFVKFFIVALTGLFASSALLAILIKLDLSTDPIKLLVSILIIPLVTYFLSKTWAFRDSKALSS